MFTEQPKLGGACQWMRRLTLVVLGARLDEGQLGTFEGVVWGRVGCP